MSSTFRGAWREIQGSLKATWSSIIQDEIGRMEADAERVAGILEGSYGLEPPEARSIGEACIWEAVLAMWSGQLAHDPDEGRRRIAARWARIPGTDLDAIDGRADRLLASIERVYGIEEWQAASEMLSFFRDWMHEDG